mmetsp:Transcript_4345/g.7653  ORF Transcript_4345/g.7653 Transcript_4345/m.7653 type:complete len:296 (-) Transcript_4345:147-1034(-)|eukprot:CAMPEP_0197651788 /NCGR_PEP_ID=MMETSP1338-20131121/34055_1 /TAXON_ID=43686 ORGANISM="Pelagodinium beii, Strain RCC1491" /NCGR_SAMPLE_ID=MMETSP1338 /ASSEMBLY_ACC=CAM_ASM_000754 /LENGTH=295 /DNA_ID=CAMNT_0043226525 /DNA_START=36 /DNA_END=923 /DNA_ORIENTATION=-
MGHAWFASRTVLPDCVPIVPAALDEDLRIFLLASLPEDESKLLDLGFEKCIDHPQCPGHHYLEGYFHSYPTDSPSSSLHPRLGSELLRPAAPAPLRAFCEVFRQKNCKAWSALQHDLEKSFNARALGAVLQRQAIFADLSVQMHWGDEIPQDHVAWHMDAPNSFLHLAIGLQGQRALHTRRSVINGRVSHNCALGASDEREVLPQAQGSAYVSSPCCFPHAVQYPEVDWSKRIVAVQCRLHLSEEELFGSLTGKQHTALDIDPNGGTAATVFRHLASMASNGLQMPTLSEVQALL